MNGVARLGVGTVKEHFGSAGVPIDKPGLFHGCDRRRPVLAAQENVHVARCPDRCFIRLGNPRPHRIAADDGIGNAGLFQCRRRFWEEDDGIFGGGTITS